MKERLDLSECRTRECAKFEVNTKLHELLSPQGLSPCRKTLTNAGSHQLHEVEQVQVPNWHLGWDSSEYMYRLGDKRQESSPTLGNLGVLLDSKLNLSQQRTGWSCVRWGLGKGSSPEGGGHGPELLESLDTTLRHRVRVWVVLCRASSWP